MDQAVQVFDSEHFRTVLGSYPTGVAVVTGFSATKEPVGLVVGSFTSVSLDPPLVAFLPMKSSKSFEVLKEGSSHFCVNILAADQEDVCRKLASPGERKFDSIAWKPSVLGDPIIEGAVAWIQCTYENILEGGDHHIVLGRVQAMDVERDTNPLLFFQRGYGKFTTGTMVLAHEQETFNHVQLAELVRDELEALAAAARLEVSLVAPVASESVYVAVANRSAEANTSRLGMATPITPPLGALFVDQAKGVGQPTWLSRLGRAPEETLQRAKAKLALARERDFSVSLLGELSAQELEAAALLYSNRMRTPEQERKFLATVSRMFDLHEPEEICADTQYSVLHLSVPVRNPQGEVCMLLRTAEFSGQLSGQAILDTVTQMKQVAEVIAKKIFA